MNDKQCVSCGKLTDWDYDLGPDPLCVECYDRLMDCRHKLSILGNEPRDAKAQYRTEHYQQISAWNKDYYERNREAILARKHERRSQVGN